MSCTCVHIMRCLDESVIECCLKETPKVEYFNFQRCFLKNCHQGYQYPVQCEKFLRWLLDMAICTNRVHPFYSDVGWCICSHSFSLILSPL